METISIMDGLILTIVSMLVVFLVLTAIWGFVELSGKLINRGETAAESEAPSSPPASGQTSPSNTLTPNKEHQRVAEITALVLASEDEPDKKFEIVETKRVK